MLFESEQFESCLQEPAGWSNNVFRYCEFSGISSDGGEIDSVFVGCTIRNCEWYWGLFNQAIFVRVDFVECSFLGSGFAGVRFVECNFLDCNFRKDNLDGDCYFDDVAWYGCTQNDCTGLSHELGNKR